jgi:parallel beta-helix repeat protein
MKKLFSIILLTLLLASMLALVFSIQPVKASGTIYIRSDGQVYPSNAPIQHEGAIYTLTDNINDSIVIQRNDIVIDGAGIYTLKGSGDYDSTGIEVNEIHNVTVQNFKGIKAFGYGILLNLSSNIIICDNTVTSNNRGGIYLANAQNCSIYGNNMTLNMNYDVELYHSSNNKVYGNNPRRILLTYSSNNNSIYENNILVSGQEGIGLSWSANNNKIYGNHIRGGLYGIHASYSSSQKIWGNNITDTIYGLHFSDSSNNIISENTVKNTTTAVFLDSSSENTIFHNNFMDFEKDAYVFDSHLNLWDAGYPIGGNYWSNYTGVDSDPDGIGDSPHRLDAENSDNFPLMGIFYNFEVSLPPYPTGSSEYVKVISNSTVECFGLIAWLSSPNQYLQPGQLFLLFNASGEGGTTGFFRIMIPRAVLNGSSYTVLVDWTPVDVTELPISSSTHVYLYFAYVHSEHEVIIIPEMPAQIILLLFMITTFLVGLMCSRKKFT